MLQRIFTIHDRKAGAYFPPFYLPQVGQAVRTFADCVNDINHEFSKHPEDYTLFAIGTFDDNTAIAITKPPESLGNGVDFVQETPQAELELEEIELEKKKGNSLPRVRKLQNGDDDSRYMSKKS